MGRTDHFDTKKKGHIEISKERKKRKNTQKVKERESKRSRWNLKKNHFEEQEVCFYTLIIMVWSFNVFCSWFTMKIKKTGNNFLSLLVSTIFPCTSIAPYSAFTYHFHSLHLSNVEPTTTRLQNHAKPLTNHKTMLPPTPLCSHAYPQHLYDAPL